MSILASISLGLSTDLTKGYCPGWNPESGKLNILHGTQKAPMQPKPLAPVSENGDWEYPEISLHETAPDLITALLGYQVEHPAIEVSSPDLPSGALALCSPEGAETRSGLSDVLGICLDDPDLRYALVKLTRKDKTVRHTTTETGVLMTVNALNPDPAIGIDSNFMRALARLRYFRPQNNLDEIARLKPDEANEFIDVFSTWGTHFVSKITVGDQIIQVFAYTSDRFERVKQGFYKNKFSGPDSVNFQYFTTDEATGAFGYVTGFGKILCLSNSDEFKKSLGDGEWMEPFWSKKNSVFQIFSEKTRVSLDRMNEDFTAQAPVKIVLSPLTTFTEYKRTAVWRRVLKGALSTVFKDSVNVGFEKIDPTDFARLLPDDEPGILSTIASPTINIYKSRLDLSDMQLVAAEEVQDFMVFGYVVAAAASTSLRIPGSRVRLFGYTLDMRATGNPNVVILTDKGYDGLTLSCSRFLGAARFENTAGSKHMVVVDGLCYEADEKSRVRVTRDIRGLPPDDSLADLKDSLEFSLAFAEAVLGLQSGNADQDALHTLIRNYLAWIGRVIPSGTTDKALLAMRVHALDLGGYSPNSRTGAFVPILPADNYEAGINRIMNYLQEIRRQISENTIQINQRKQAELTIDVGKALNKNIIESGKLLTGLIKANADSAAEVARQYDAVITSRKAEAKFQEAKIADLKKQVFEQQAEVSEAVQVYRSRVKQWETMELIKFGLDVSTNLFDLGTSVLIPSSAISAVKELGRAAQMIKKTLNVLNGTMKLYQTVSGTLQSLSNAEKTLDGMDGMEFGDTSRINWDEMSIQLDVVMATGPSDASVIEAKAKMVAAFKILVVRGKAMVSAQSALHQIQRDIYMTQRQKELNMNQENRLKTLTTRLNPENIKNLDRSAIDLVGLTGRLEYMHRQMLTTFSKSFLLQDQALQYAWLQPSTMISSYSLLTFMKARIAQSQATMNAKSHLLQYQAATTDEIVYEVDGILTDSISGGRSCQIVINPESREFTQYVNLRVVGVTATVDGVKSTDSGKLLVRLTFEDFPFVDRNVDRQPLTFHTPWRERTYQFDTATNTPEFSDKGQSWSDGVSRITPFGSWRVDLPKTELNKGLTFKAHTVKLRLCFILKARIVDKPVRTFANLTARRAAPGMEILRTAAMSVVTAGAVRPSSPTLISQMNAQGSTTNGWDIVFNMGLSRINASLRDQYNTLKHAIPYKNTIDAITRTKVVEGVWAIKKFHMEYGYPLLTFSVNNDNTVKLQMPIEKGALTNCIQTGSDPEKCDPPISIAGKLLTAIVELAKTQGTVQVDGKNHNILKVELDMSQGAFTVDNIEISDEEKVELNKAVKAYFAKNPVIYLINRLDLTNIPVLEDMRPNGFLFKVLKTPSESEMLQMFIQTGNRALLNPTLTFLNGVSDPLPSGMETSLIVRSKLFFEKILPQSMTKGGWSLEGRSDTGSAKASWAEFTNAPVSASGISLKDLTQVSTYTSPRGMSGSSTTTTYAFPNNTVTWNLSGMTLKPTSGGDMTLSGSKKQTMTIKTTTSFTHWPCFSKCTRVSHGSFTNDATSKVSATVPISVTGDGRDQQIAISMAGQAVTVTGHLAGGGPSGSDNLQAQVNQQVKKHVPGQVAGQLNISFNTISVFAVKNLLFPSNNYIQFAEAAIPGDMLLLGNFKAIS